MSHIVSPKTGRTIKVGGQAYTKLVASKKYSPMVKSLEKETSVGTSTPKKRVKRRRRSTTVVIPSQKRSLCGCSKR